MSEQQALKRRGLIAGAAALMAGIAAKQTGQPVRAASSADQFDATGTGLPGFYAEGSNSTGGAFVTGSSYMYGVDVSGTDTGVRGTGPIDGVYGNSSGRSGVHGVGTSGSDGVYGEGANANGVHGTSTSTTGGAGVRGFNNSGNNAIGVLGATGAVGIAVLGGTKGGNTAFFGYGVRGLSDNGYGVSGEAAAGRGVNASSDSGYGVYASAGGNYAAVYATNTATGDGVYGTTPDPASAGIHGAATTDYGTAIKADTPRYGFGVYATGGSYGVTGIGSSVGVSGYSAAGTGVFGHTTASYQYGVLGQTTAVNSTAIAGVANTNGSSAFSGGTTNPNAFAGYFQGTVVVQGNFAVTGNKSAALAYPDGSHRLVYCIESPDSWLEDVGTGTLVNGTATVTFDKEFAALVHANDYHVFLTEYETHKALCVANRTASGFAVRTEKVGATGTFSWRVLVKRADVKGERLGKFTLPNLPLPDVAKYKVPEPPKTPPSSAPASQSVQPPGAQQPAANRPVTGSAPNPLPAPRT